MLMYLVVFNLLLLSREIRSHLAGAENDSTTPTPITLPSIKLGDKCELNKMYQMDCNTCRCGQENHLICTKMACNSLDLAQDLREFQESRKLSKQGKKVLRNKNPLKKPQYPPLPKGDCTPGVIYEHKCQTCFCNAEMKAECANSNACALRSKGKRKVTQPEDVRPPINDQEFGELPTLAHHAIKCKPGLTYKVDCNICVCDDKENLICDKMLCFSERDMLEAEADKFSGSLCNSTKISISACIKCKCSSKGKLNCRPLENCIAKKENMLRMQGRKEYQSRYALDHKKDSCVAEGVYRDGCNKCYCQADNTLICTQKFCLRYTEFQKLEEEIKQLRMNDV